MPWDSFEIRLTDSMFGWIGYFNGYAYADWYALTDENRARWTTEATRRDLRAQADIALAELEQQRQPRGLYSNRPDASIPMPADNPFGVPPSLAALRGTQAVMTQSPFNRIIDRLDRRRETWRPRPRRHSLSRAIRESLAARTQWSVQEYSVSSKIVAWRVTFGGKIFLDYTVVKVRNPELDKVAIRAKRFLEASVAEYLNTKPLPRGEREDY